MAKWYNDCGIRKVRYVVVNEYAIGYIYEEDPDTIGILRASPLRGWPSVNDDPISTFGKTIRDATLQDFEDYRVYPPKVMEKENEKA